MIAFQDAIDEFVASGYLDKAIAKCEAELKALPVSPFHRIIGCDLENMTPDTISWLESFYDQVAKNEFKPKAIYCETNGFDMNTDRWFVDAFAFRRYKKTEDWDWLSDWDSETEIDSLTIQGYESMQNAFAQRSFSNRDDKTQNAAKIAELLVILRVQELFRNAHQAIYKKGLELGRIPLLVTAHDWDLIFISRP